MVVNAAGARFGNEVNFQALAPTLRVLDWTTRQHRNLPCWMIGDHSDEDFGRKPGRSMIPGFGSGPNASLGAIATPPFYRRRR
jgi:hypothetical protein